jgi:hypothetical protein
MLDHIIITVSDYENNIEVVCHKEF